MSDMRYTNNRNIHKATMDISIQQDQVLLYYKGIIKRIKGRNHRGEVMELPFDIFLDYVSTDGLHGTFEITYSSDGGLVGKLVQLRKLS